MPEEDSQEWGFTKEDFQMIEKMQKDLSDLRQQIRQNVKSFGTKPRQIRTYTSDQRNFTDGEWEFLQKIRQEASQFRKDMLEALEVEEGQEEKENKKAKERKKKFKKRQQKLSSEELSSNQSIKKRKRIPGVKKRWLQM